MEEKPSLEDVLMDAILQKNCLTVNKILEQGVNVNKLCRGRTPLGVAAEIGDTVILNSILATITNQNSNTSNNASLATTTTTTSTAHRTKKQKCDYSSAEENSTKNVNKSVDKKNLGYFIMVHGDIDVNNPLCEQHAEEKTPEGMDALEWDVEIKDNQDDNQIPERERDQWVSLYRWYADILDKAADMLKVPIIYDINQQDSAGKTALHYAAHRGRVQAAQILINAGCQLDIASSDSCTPLHMACQSNSLETVNLLLESGARVDPRLYNKKTPLHLAAKRDRADFVEALIKKGAQIDAQDAQDRTPLSIAVMNEAASAVQVLLKYGAKVNFEDVHGYTPLCEAVWQKSETMVRALLNAGAKITQSHCLLHSSVWHQDKTIAQMLLDAGSVPNMANNEGDTPIFVAVRNGDIEMVELLLRYGAEINYFSVNGKNVIHEVVDHLFNVDEFKRMFEFLVENGADVNQHSCLVSDLTPLSRALFFERPGVAAVLIRHGIDINFYDSLLHEYTLCVARRKKYFTISRLLIYSGFDARNHSTSDLKHLPDNSMYDVNTVDGWLAYVKHNPLSLSQLCRIHIRRRCGTQVYKIVNQLPLPHLVKKYLKLEDEECDNSLGSL